MSSTEQVPNHPNSDHNYAKTVEDHNDDHDETGQNLNQFESTHLTKIRLMTEENNLLRQLFRNFDRINFDGTSEAEAPQLQQRYRILKRKYRQFLRNHPRRTFTDLYADFSDNFPMVDSYDDDGGNSICRHSDDDEEFYEDGGDGDGYEESELQFDEEELKLFEKWWKYDGDGGGLEGTSTTSDDRPRRPPGPIRYRCDFIGCQFETGRFDSMNRHNYTMHIVGYGAQLPEDYDNFNDYDVDNVDHDYNFDDNDEEYDQDYQQQQPMGLDSDLQNELADFFVELENWSERIDDGDEDVNIVVNDEHLEITVDQVESPSSSSPTNPSSSSTTTDLPPPSEEHCLPPSSISEMSPQILPSPPRPSIDLSPSTSNLNDNVESDGQTKSAEELLLPCPVVNTSSSTQSESDDGGDSDDTDIVTDEDDGDDSDTDADQVVNDGGPLEVPTNHSVDRPALLQCPFDGCEYTAKFLSRLKRHQLVHSTERFHQCPDCPKSCKLLGNLKQHQKHSHGGMARFSCSYDRCSKSYSYKSNLDEHVRIVHEKSAQLLRCTIDGDGCDYTTYRKRDLEQHLLTHSDQREYRCDLPECGKSFTLSWQLTRHQQSVHQGVRFWCTFDDCGRSYRSKQSLDYHRKRDHAPDESTDGDDLDLDLDVQQGGGF